MLCPVTIQLGASKGQVWTGYCAPAVPAFPRPSLPEETGNHLATAPGESGGSRCHSGIVE